MRTHLRTILDVLVPLVVVALIVLLLYNIAKKPEVEFRPVATPTAPLRVITAEPLSEICYEGIVYLKSGQALAPKYSLSGSESNPPEVQKCRQ